MDGSNPCPTLRYTEGTLKSEHKAMCFLQNNEATRPHSRGHSIYEAEAKVACNEAKAEALIFGLKAEAISRT